MYYHLLVFIFFNFELQANRKFNHALSENKDLRNDIDHMRTERVIFQNLYKKLEKVLNLILTFLAYKTFPTFFLTVINSGFQLSIFNCLELER